MRVVVDANTVLSGLFFAGNERRLLVASLRGEVTLLYAEDVVDQVYEVIERIFHDHPDLSEALERLESILMAGGLVARSTYAEKIPMWSRRLRDPEDAPVLACAAAMQAEGIVTGDRDILDLAERDDIQVYRTRELLELLGLPP